MYFSNDFETAFAAKTNHTANTKAAREPVARGSSAATSFATARPDKVGELGHPPLSVRADRQSGLPHLDSVYGSWGRNGTVSEITGLIAFNSTSRKGVVLSFRKNQQPN
jgi:hypothetical protein